MRIHFYSYTKYFIQTSKLIYIITTSMLHYMITLEVKVCERTLSKTQYSFTNDIIKSNFSKSIDFKSLKVLDLL